ncbi:MAG: efflux RND transporter periplasmic adaptor subunit [Gammaproteobacteria bacterium]|nr:efflux RND transporter periplasmic adaptor subunit [Gammaproteobacteria bacterium]
MGNSISHLKHIRLPAIILVLGLGAIALVTLSKPSPTPNPDMLAEPPKTRVLVKPAQRETVTLSVTSQGTVKPKREIDVVAQVSGRIVKAEQQFVNGAFFEQGSLLVEIDPSDYQAAFLDTQASVAQAQRVLAEEAGRSRQAKKEWRDLGNSEANDLFLRKPHLAEARSALASAQAELKVAKRNLERTRVSVPFDGRISETSVNLGQFVSVGTTLAKVYDIAAAEVRLPLSDRQLSMLDLPLDFASAENRSAVTLSATIAGKVYQWQGAITRSEATIDVNSRMYYAIAEVANPFQVSEAADRDVQAPLIPGLFVTAEISGKSLDDVLVLPRAALVKRNNIYTLDADNKVQSNPVTVLKKEADTVWLQSAIAEGTAILLEKHALVSPGTEVEPLPEGNGPAGDVAHTEGGE